MRYRRACSLVAITALLASVMVATTSRMQVSPIVRTVAVGTAPVALALDGGGIRSLCTIACIIVWVIVWVRRPFVHGPPAPPGLE
jgi:hypothetical protein